MGEPKAEADCRARSFVIPQIIRLHPKVLKLLELIQLALFAWVLWLPVSNNLILYPVLALMTALSLTNLCSVERVVPRGVVWGLATYGIFLVIWVPYSYFRETPGFFHQSLVWVGMPIIWFCWASAMTQPQLIRTVRLILALGTVHGLTLTYYGLHALGYVADLPDWLKNIQRMRYTISPLGGTELGYLGISALVIISVFATALVFLKTPQVIAPRAALVAVALVTFLGAVMSGRRVLVMIILIAPIAVTVVRLVQSVRSGGLKEERTELATGIGAFAVIAALIFVSPLGGNIRQLTSDLTGISIAISQPAPSGAPKPSASSDTSGTPKPSASSDASGTPKPSASSDASNPGDFETEVDLLAGGDAIRIHQSAELLVQWKVSPIMGSGLGATLESGYKRSAHRPWMFEIQPLQILMNVGLAGVLLISISVVIALRGMLRTRSTYPHVFVAALVSAGGLMLAGVTNPYLQAVGHGWGLFLPLAVVMTRNGSDALPASPTTVDR